MGGIEEELAAMPIKTDPISSLARKMGAIVSPSLGWCIKDGSHRIFVKPFIARPDLNNQREQDFLDCNPPVPSTVIGLKFSF